MIEVICQCAKPRKMPASAIGKRFLCPACKQTLQIVSAEPLEDGGGDFDASLTILSGPADVGTKILLGGVVDIDIGKLPERHLSLHGPQVSRQHCKLVRLDFAPSRWRLVDTGSTHGVFVNQDRIADYELQDGDLVSIGDFQLRYCISTEPLPPRPPAPAVPAHRAAAYRVPAHVAAAAAAQDPLVPDAPGLPCPSCAKTMARSAKICVDCGINLKTGRTVLTSQGIDVESLYEGAYQWIWWVSLLIWVTPMPIPIRSEAFGTRKPYAIWTIAILTVLASLAFFMVNGLDKSGDEPGRELMLWAPSRFSAESSEDFTPKVQWTKEDFRAAAKVLSPEARQGLHDRYDPRGKLSDEEVLEKFRAEVISMREQAPAKFHYYQLITHAFLHDTSSFYNFVMHLTGNMLFLLVFGTRVNSLIGNLATAIVYPLLAVSSAGIYLWSLGDAASGPSLGASGAIMGLAGMYLILFPAHQVFCAMWISLWFRFRRYHGCKIFPMRGFWLLLIYFGYDLVMNGISKHFHTGSGVAHWAHIGGFISGAVVALGVLASRKFNTRGGDLLSVALGKNAWPLIGRPSQWAMARTAGLPRATSLNM